MLYLNMEFRKGILFVRLKGQLLKENATRLKKELEKLIEKQGIKYFVFNLEKLEVLDEAGLKMLHENYQEIDDKNGKFLLCGVNNTIQLTLEKDKLLSKVEKVSNELNAFQYIEL